MGEYDKTGCQTAMEWLARELMDAVCDYSGPSCRWCDEAGMDVRGKTSEECKELARADIERRIEAARAEDEYEDKCEDAYSVRELKRLTGMHTVGGHTTLGEVAEMVAVVEGWKEKAAELDALRDAGRIMPEGASWPAYGDGGQARMDGEAWTRKGERMRVVAVSHRGKVAVRPWDAKGGGGARWVPASSLLGERSDSWERLEEDANKSVHDYWGCIGIYCDNCPAKVDGKTPRDRYETEWCVTAKHLDIVARAKRLAGVSGDGR